MFRTGGVEGVYRAQRVDFERFDGQRLVIAHAGGRGEIVDLVAANPELVDDVVADIAEFRMRGHVAQQRRIGDVARVHAENFVPFVQQTQTQVGADESHAAQYDYSLLHLVPVFYRSGSKIRSIPMRFLLFNGLPERAPGEAGRCCLSARPRSLWGACRLWPDSPRR